MPVSKKRKSKKNKRSYQPPSKAAAPPPPKITKQKILIYIISALMILSLVGGYLLSGAQSSVTPTPVPRSDNILQETPASDTESNNAESEATSDSADN